MQGLIKILGGVISSAVGHQFIHAMLMIIVK
jgi:hypothetical protein